MSIRKGLVGAVVLTAMCESSVQAASITIYTSLADWTAAAPGPTVLEDFSSATVNTSGPIFDTLDNLLSGFSVRSSIQGASLDGGAYSDFVNWGPGYGGPEDAPMMQFAYGTRGFGADWNLGTVYGGLTVLAGFSDGSSASAVMVNSFSGTYAGFLGFISTGDITSVRLLNSTFGPTAGQSFTMDNARMISAMESSEDLATPEPGALTLTAIALCLGRAATRAKRR